MQVGFIGAGQMARALATGFVAQQQVRADRIAAADCVQQSLHAFQKAVPEASVTSDNGEVVRTSDVVFLAVKPQHMPMVFSSLPESNGECLFVSIAAGVPLSRLVDGLGTDRVVRVMPNTPCLVGQGAAGFCRATGASDEDGNLVQRLLQAVGQSWELPEALLDTVTGLSGSGPAFVFLFIEALSDGAVHMGLPRSVAQQLAAQTVRGAAEMLLESDEHPAVLKDRVASPGGTTMAGIQALEERAFRATVMQAVEAATRRSRELGRAE